MPYPDDFSMAAYEARFGGPDDEWEDLVNASLYTAREAAIRSYNADLRRLVAKARALEFCGTCPLAGHDAGSIGDHLEDMLIPESDLI